jgi:hypothetical protein
MLATFMRAVNLNILVLVGVSFAVPPLTAVLAPSGGLQQSSTFLYVASKKSSKKKGHNYSSGNGFIPGYVPTPYGRGDCIGWWEPIGNGLFRCHGQFIRTGY